MSLSPWNDVQTAARRLDPWCSGSTATLKWKGWVQLSVDSLLYLFAQSSVTELFFYENTIYA